MKVETPGFIISSASAVREPCTSSALALRAFSFRLRSEDVIGGRFSASFDGFIDRAQEIMLNVFIAWVAGGDRKSWAFAAISSAFAGTNEGTAPPLRGAKALTVGEVAGLIDLLVAQIVNACGRNR